MSVDLSSAEQQASIPGFSVTSALARQPQDGALYDAVAEDGRRVELWVVPASDTPGLLDDVQALAETRHRHLPEIVDFGEAAGSVYVATRPVEGPTLEELIRENGPLTPMSAVRLLGDAADALDAAHAAGLVHTRLSTSSIVVERRPVEHALVQGFALGARAKDDDARADDVEAFARVMFECLTGEPPHDGTPASQLRPELPEALDAVLARGLAREEDRPATTAAQLVADAARAVMAVGPAAPAAEPSEPAPPPLKPPPEPPTGAPEPEAPVAAPERTPEPAPEKERVPLRRRIAGATVPFVIAVLVVAAAAVGGWLVGKPETAPSAVKEVSAGSVELGLPGGWREERAARELGGLRLRDGLSASGPGNGRMDAGFVGGTLPGRVGSRVARDPGDPEAVRLGDFQAYQWKGVEERGGRDPITLFASATDRGIVVLACRGTASARARCESSAGYLDVPDGLPARLSELAAWATRLDGVMSRLSRRRGRDRARMRSARTPRGLSLAARRVARDYSAARRKLASNLAPIGAAAGQREVERSLARISVSYRRLGSAARRQRSRRYRAARRQVERRERALKRTLRRL